MAACQSGDQWDAAAPVGQPCSVLDPSPSGVMDSWQAARPVL